MSPSSDVNAYDHCWSLPNYGHPEQHVLGDLRLVQARHSHPFAWTLHPCDELVHRAVACSKWLQREFPARKILVRLSYTPSGIRCWWLPQILPWDRNLTSMTYGWVCVQKIVSAKSLTSICKTQRFPSQTRNRASDSRASICWRMTCSSIMMSILRLVRGSLDLHIRSLCWCHLSDKSDSFSMCNLPWSRTWHLSYGVSAIRFWHR